MTRKIRVLVVDDSAYARTALSTRLSADPDIEVAGHARDGIEAVDKVRELRPDVVTLDVVMPKQDGLEALERIMKETPTPVVMASALTREGAKVTIRALELGAVDFILKPTRSWSPDADASTNELAVKVKEAAKANIKGAGQPTRSSVVKSEARPRSPASRPKEIVVIAASTGGPQTLRTVLTSLPPDISVPILVVQHMPAGFSRSLAERLNELGPLPVAEASHDSRLEKGRVLLAPGGFHMTIGPRGDVKLDTNPPECGVRPSVNPTMESVTNVYRSATLGVVLTGMGSDGTRGAQLIRAAGGEVLVEDEASCVVYGMPKSVIEAGYADYVAPLSQVASDIARMCQRNRQPAVIRQ
jgi:two-component system chemotaxis response regulator CheB